MDTTGKTTTNEFVTKRDTKYSANAPSQADLQVAQRRHAKANLTKEADVT